MNQPLLRGIELRYVLTMHLAVHGPATVAELIDVVGYQGFRVQGRPSKAVSDALRWEIDHGRVHRLGQPVWARLHSEVDRIPDPPTRAGLASGRCRSEAGKKCAASWRIREWRM